MPNYVLYLKSNGDGFTCAVEGKDVALLSKKIPIRVGQIIDRSGETCFAYLEKNDRGYHYVYRPYNIVSPGCLSISSDSLLFRIEDKDVNSQIKQALACTSRSEVKNFLQQTDLDSSDNIRLYHEHYIESMTDGNFSKNHSFIKGAAHKESKSEMLDFVNEREAFYRKNYLQGYSYQKMSLVNLVWPCVYMKNKFLAVKTYFGITTLMCLLSGFKITQYFEDFNAGRAAADNNQGLFKQKAENDHDCTEDHKIDQELPKASR